MANVARFRVVALVCCGLLLTAAHHTSKTETLMFEAAEVFMTSLNRVQRSYTLFDFDAKHRMDWHYFPEGGFTRTYGYVRNGVTFKDMDPRQKHLANALLASGLSGRGFNKAAQVMSLEEIIRIIEDDHTGHRDPEGFHFSIFGKPSLEGSWGWRVEGHHLSLHYTIKDGKLVSSSPTFFGANPHEVAQGPHKGLRVLAKEEDMALALLKGLDSEQLKQAIFQEVAPEDIVTMADTRARMDGDPQGLAASKMNDRQYAMLLGLIAEYANNTPAPVAAARMKSARETSRDRLFFAWAGKLNRPRPKAVPIGSRTTGNREEKGNYYRIQAPSFLIEYDNTQNQSNHSHSVWRDFENDFGRDVLALHYQRYDHRMPEGPTYSADLKPASRTGNF